LFCGLLVLINGVVCCVSCFLVHSFGSVACPLARPKALRNDLQVGVAILPGNVIEALASCLGRFFATMC
jgi:hypothetical protein